MRDPNTKTFHHALEEVVKIITSGESGIVIGRAEHQNTNDQYLIEYKAADGRAVQEWWFENQTQKIA
ncbi:MAG: hypothetical protein ABJM82_00020 [Shimia thalassica]|uniref:hypothetical protein n=1 Tax=Shimia thalassica TaxID=1715693 RepID=UPI0032995ED0